MLIKNVDWAVCQDQCHAACHVTNWTPTWQPPPPHWWCWSPGKCPQNSQNQSFYKGGNMILYETFDYILPDEAIFAAHHKLASWCRWCSCHPEGVGHHLSLRLIKMWVSFCNILQILTTNISMKVVCAEFDQKILYRAQPKNHFQHAGSLVQASLFFIVFAFLLLSTGPYIGQGNFDHFASSWPQQLSATCH